MASSSSESMPVTTADEATGTQDIFNKQLETYRRVVATNLMFHREVYGLLRDLLVGIKPARVGWIGGAQQRRDGRGNNRDINWLAPVLCQVELRKLRAFLEVRQKQCHPRDARRCRCT